MLEHCVLGVTNRGGDMVEIETEIQNKLTAGVRMDDGEVGNGVGGAC